MAKRVNDLARILCESGGMIGIKSKPKVNSKEYLGMVYTPGVGPVCKEIEKDPSKALELTNKGNSCIVLTDGSGYPGFDPATWVQEQTIPKLEVACLFYKAYANIDAYPLLADSKLVKDGNCLYDIICALSTSYSAVHLLGISEEREKQYTEAMKQKSPGCFVWNSSIQREVEKILQELKLNEYFSARLVAAITTRVAMDSQIYGTVSLDQIRDGLSKLTGTLTADTSELEMLSDLTEALQASFGKTKAQGALQDSQSLVRTNYVFGGELRTYDTHDYEMNSNTTNAIYIHKRFRGMIESYPKVKIGSIKEFERFATEEKFNAICDKIKDDPELADFMTVRKNYSAIITNGTAILGYGNIGALAGYPVMEGKCILFKELGTVNMIPICLQETNPDKFIAMVQKISPIFTSINLEDIKAPDCFKIETELKKTCRPAIFHDDQHGTAIVVTAAILNYVKLVNKKIENLSIVVNGGGAAGISICKLLMNAGVGHIVVCDTSGSIFEGRKENMNAQKQWIAENTNQKKVQGSLADVMKGADVVIGVSAAGAIKPEMVSSMAEKSFVMALANPEPEIYPEEAKKAGAFVTATGRGDFANQVNNSLAFPGLFKAIYRHRANSITEDMKLAAAKALASLVTPERLNPDRVIPEPLSVGIPIKIAEICGEEAKREGIIRPMPKSLKDMDIDLDSVVEH